MSAPAPVIIKSKDEPWTPKEMKKQLKSNLEFYKKVSEGLPVVPSDEAFIEDTKRIASELYARGTEYIAKYKELYESTETKRVTAIKPRLCDQKLTLFLSHHFKRYLPDNGQYGILDLNRVVPRAFSLYFKEKGLGETQFFFLDEPLRKLFESPSVGDPTKSYLQLAQERINEIRMTPNHKPSASSAEIIVSDNRITMNYSALKIITPKFGVKYEITDPQQYVPQLTEFNTFLKQLVNQYEERKKSLKKSSKK